MLLSPKSPLCLGADQGSLPEALITWQVLLGNWRKPKGFYPFEGFSEARHENNISHIVGDGL